MGRLQLKSDPHTDKPDWWSSDEWSTPPEFLEQLTERLQLRPFDLDPCCRPETSVAAKYYTLADNGLLQPWAGLVWVPSMPCAAMPSSTWPSISV